MTSIQVICRFRPNPNDQTTSPYQIFNNESVVVEGATFNFDKVFTPGTQSEIYAVAAEPVIQGVLEGFNGTVVAYGQTASGKTYTMNGGDGPKEEGIINRMVGTVFEHISNSSDDTEFRIKISVIEIYMEKIRDLLNPSKSDLKIREDKTRGIYIQDVTENYVSHQSEIYDSLKLCQQNRQISSTNMNEQSSRSHMIFFLTLTTSNVVQHYAKTGRLFLVDLAGSEKVSKTGAEGRTLDEAKGINKSLMALGQVINALTTLSSKEHIPYRSSKLTRILQCSFGGNSRTSLIITCSQERSNLQETLTTLRFGSRAKNIKNKPKINKEFTNDELKQIVAERDLEIANLKEMLLKSVVQQKSKLDDPADIVKQIDQNVSTQVLTHNDHQEDQTIINDEFGELVSENIDLKTNMLQVRQENERLRQEIADIELESQGHLIKLGQSCSEGNFINLEVPQQEIIDNLNDQIMLLVHENKKLLSRQTITKPDISNYPENFQVLNDQIGKRKYKLKLLEVNSNKLSFIYNEAEKSFNSKCLVLENNMEGMLKQFYDIVTQKSLNH